jgi:UDP-glucose 4-epimerase
MRRILVTAGRSPLGRAVVEMLRAAPAVEQVRGLEARPSQDGRDEGEIDFVSFVPDHRPLVEYLGKERIDTVIQCGLLPDRSGLGAKLREADVITTMCLGAAIGQEGSTVRSWILASSTDVYPIGSHSARFQGERQDLYHEEDSLSASIAEAEDYARDVAHRLPHVSVAILRLQQLVGAKVRGPLASLLARNPVPTLIGFDPAIQLLHIEDAANALAFAAIEERAGVYNVASRGTLHWHDAIRATGHGRLPLLPLNLAFLEPLLERLGLPFVSADLQDLLRFGHAVDTQKIEAAGWRAQFDQRECLALLRDP